MQQNDFKQIGDVATRGGLTFVSDYYYKIYDTTRQELYRFYKDQSLIIWCGTPIRGTAVINEFFKSLPGSKHTLISIDCQPVIMPIEFGIATTATTISVSVAGNVVYGDKTAARLFNQQFLLIQEQQGSFFVAYDCFRLLS